MADNINSESRSDPMEYLQDYTASEDLPREGWFASSPRTAIEFVRKKNADCIRAYVQALDTVLTVPFANYFLLMVTLNYPKPKNYLGGEETLKREELEKLSVATPKLIDIADRVRSFPQLVQLRDPIFIGEGELQDLKRKLSKVNAKKPSAEIVLQLMKVKGYPVEVLLPRFRTWVESSMTNEKSFELTGEKIMREAEKIRIARHVLSQQKAFDTICVSDFTSAKALARQIYQRFIPFDLLSETALCVLLGNTPLNAENSKLIQQNLDLITNMSKDLRFVMSPTNSFEFVNLEQWVHIPKGFVTGSPYKILATFDVPKFYDFMKKSTWATLAGFDPKKGTLQFYTPDPGPIFYLNHPTSISLGMDIQGIASRLVRSDDPNLNNEDPSNYNMIKKLQASFMSYFLMKELSKLLKIEEKLKACRIQNSKIDADPMEMVSTALQQKTNNAG